MLSRTAYRFILWMGLAACCCLYPFVWSTCMTKRSRSRSRTPDSRLEPWDMKMQGFPPPKFLGCDRSTSLCTFENVCLSRHDGLMVFDVPGGLQPDVLKNEKETWYSGDGKALDDGPRVVSVPRRPILIPKARYDELRHVHFAEAVFAVNCWRQPAQKYNPAHLMLGIGDLFVYASGYYTHGKAPPPIDVVVFHQCPTTDEWAWGHMMDRFIWKDAVRQGVIGHTNTAEDPYGFETDGRIFMPSEKVGKVDDANDLIICCRTLYQDLFPVPLYLGPNPPAVIQRWQGLVDQFLQQQMPSNEPAPTALYSSPSPERSSCARNLRIAVWQRTEGSALRLLTNMEDIKQLVGEFSDHPVEIVTASSSTPPLDQIATFRSFDILITSHGSHLTNMIFSSHAVFIEVAAVYYDKAPLQNGRTFAKDWILSLGHLPISSALRADMSLCQAHNFSSPCPREKQLKYIQSDLVVNTTILHTDLQRAIAALCEATEQT